jgi:hypothetical protein
MWSVQVIVRQDGGEWVSLVYYKAYLERYPALRFPVQLKGCYGYSSVVEKWWVCTVRLEYVLGTGSKRP